MWKRLIPALTILVLLTGITTASAQDGSVVVPDVTGMTPPQAAALLNEAGLRIGVETAAGWTAESGQDINTISAQAIAPGETVAQGTAIDITVLRIPNVSIQYDDNDISLINLGEHVLPLGNITFRAVDGSGQTFAADRVPSNALEPGDCMQVWSVGRSSPKSLPECTGSIFWLTTNDPGDHFWTGAGGTTQFTLVQDGVQRGICGVANPGRCDLYLAAGIDADTTPYVYFAYTVDDFAIVNQSEAQFMTLPGLQLADAAGTTFAVTDATFYSEVNPVADLARLAPGQCLYTGTAPGGTPPEDCTVVAETVTEAAFWRGEFTFTSVTDGEQRTCPGAIEGRMTLCILPR